MVDPDHKVMTIAGDGGFLMNVQEMETARRLNSDIVVMMWEDGGYGLIEWKQDNTYGNHTDLSFGNPKWGLLAESFGWSFDYVAEAAKRNRERTDHSRSIADRGSDRLSRKRHPHPQAG
jgi:acetolactate synthase-1/2/3 large subunit